MSTSELDLNNISPLLLDHAERMQITADVGYTISLVTSTLAVIILTCVKKLRCARNHLHLQLFASFIIRCITHIIQKVIAMYALSETSAFNLEGFYCKIFTVIWQYSLLANYNWVLMEGLYLYSLIFYAVISPNGPSIVRYILFGWGLPLLCIIPWAMVKATFEDTECWTTNNNVAYFWIIRAPITISILLNFILYIRIILVLYSKIFSGTMTIQKRQTDRNYKKWFRSTLVLVPLFGVHHFILLIFNYVASPDTETGRLAEVIWLYIDLLFTSCQGCVVAFLYCFLNEEVQQELISLWRRYTSGASSIVMTNNNGQLFSSMNSDIIRNNGKHENI